MADAKPRLLWVARRYREGAEEMANAEKKITERLSTDFDLVQRFNLLQSGYSLVNLVDREQTPFSAMVTHVEPVIEDCPPNVFSRVDSLSFSYGRSLNLVKCIKDVAQRKIGRAFPIVAYTGMMYPEEAKDVFVKRGPIDFLVFKRQPEKWEASYREIYDSILSGLFLK